MLLSLGFRPSAAERSAIALARRRCPSSSRAKASAIRLFAEYSRPRPARAVNWSSAERSPAASAWVNSWIASSPAPFSAAAWAALRSAGPAACRFEANSTRKTAAKTDLIISNESCSLAPAANGAAIPASHDIRDDAAQDLFRNEDLRLARRLQLVPN